ncbi:hypothetical protein KIM67_18350 [Flagellimonas sp. 389]|uniref:hypothetical protein n=1 Tax=Flagellimonas sp. 389 TaxID=2835862 RepID=UPI001BD259AA|nr:hypothetical protein [Flagellimonas sp. 389]MBS9464389.1 hypothetical protein [Flagellimonas sp. 389]
MDSSIIPIIVGGGIAIVSGAVGHFISYHFKSKSERKKYVFEKLDDIINCISNIEQMMQEDIAGIFKLLNPNEKREISLSFQQNKLECLVKIYHPDLSIAMDKLKKKIRKYHSTKLEIVTMERRSETDKKLIKDAYNRLSAVFDEFTEETKSFITDLAEYGHRKTR